MPHKTPPQEGWTPTPTLHHWQCASYAQPPLMLHLLFAADKTFEFSSETTEMSKAAGFPRSQSCTRISAGLDWERSVLSPAPASTWTDKCAVWKDSAKISRRLLWRNVASPPLLQVVAWWPRGSRQLIVLSIERLQCHPGKSSGHVFWCLQFCYRIFPVCNRLSTTCNRTGDTKKCILLMLLESCRIVANYWVVIYL